MLDVTHRSFNYWVYRTPVDKRYTTFSLPKKNGEQRRIDAPTDNIKILQQKLNQVLQAVYQNKPSVHGFVDTKSVRSNAESHIKKSWVLNLDLKDFFPSINFGRVRGMFMAKPYNIPENAATVLAHLCCYEKRLPQGAPTSPVVSNMICGRMDSELQRLAARNRSTYTRYADDITFSTTQRRFPRDLAYRDELKQIRPGNELLRVIADNGFSVNYDKVWLRGKSSRQTVTGVTVNEFPNLPKRYISQIRAMLHAWEKYGLEAAQEEWEAKYDTKHRAPWLPVPKFEQVVKGKIEYLGMIRGQDSTTYLRLIDQIGELEPKLTGGRGTPLRLLFKKFESLSQGEATPQVRGLLFEELMNEMCSLEDILIQKSFRRNAGGEQIDGSFDLDGWYYLVECKWESKLSSQAEIDSLSGKLGRSGAQTMGVFISVNGWSPHVPGLVKQARDKRIFLIDGQDIRAVLSGRLKLIDLLRAKSQDLNLRAEPYLSAEEVLSRST